MTETVRNASVRVAAAMDRKRFVRRFAGAVFTTASLLSVGKLINPSAAYGYTSDCLSPTGGGCPTGCGPSDCCYIGGRPSGCQCGTGTNCLDNGAHCHGYAQTWVVTAAGPATGRNAAEVTSLPTLQRAAIARPRAATTTPATASVSNRRSRTSASVMVLLRARRACCLSPSLSVSTPEIAQHHGVSVRSGHIRDLENRTGPFAITLCVRNACRPPRQPLWVSHKRVLHCVGRACPSHSSTTCHCVHDRGVDYRSGDTANLLGRRTVTSGLAASGCCCSRTCLR
jgi:hypothetical protein